MQVSFFAGLFVVIGGLMLGACDRRDFSEKSSGTPSGGNSLPQVSAAQLSDHATETSCWMSMDGMVYDVTSYFSKHPGGKNAMLRYCGKDAGAAFYGKPHSDSAKEIRNGFLVGRLTVSGNLTHRDGEVQPAPTAAPEPTEVPTAAPTAVPTIAPTVVPAPDVTPAPTPVDKMITKAEVAQHSVKADCWIIIEKSVYDITNYFAEHPGGDAPVRFCGKDATAVFNRIHDDFAKELREKYRIGALAD